MEEYYNIGHGGDRKSKPNNSALKTQKELAEENGISADTMQNYKRLASSIPEMQELLNTGKVTPTRPQKRSESVRRQAVQKPSEAALQTNVHRYTRNDQEPTQQTAGRL